MRANAVRNLVERWHSIRKIQSRVCVLQVQPITVAHCRIEGDLGKTAVGENGQSLISTFLSQRNGSDLVVPAPYLYRGECIALHVRKIMSGQRLHSRQADYQRSESKPAPIGFEG